MTAVYNPADETESADDYGAAPKGPAITRDFVGLNRSFWEVSHPVYADGADIHNAVARPDQIRPSVWEIAEDGGVVDLMGDVHRLIGATITVVEIRLRCGKSWPGAGRVWTRAEGGAHETRAVFAKRAARTETSYAAFASAAPHLVADAHPANPDQQAHDQRNSAVVEDKANPETTYAANAMAAVQTSGRP